MCQSDNRHPLDTSAPRSKGTGRAPEIRIYLRPVDHAIRTGRFATRASTTEVALAVGIAFAHSTGLTVGATACRSVSSVTSSNIGRGEVRVWPIGSTEIRSIEPIGIRRPVVRFGRCIRLMSLHSKRTESSGARTRTNIRSRREARGSMQSIQMLVGVEQLRSRSSMADGRGLSDQTTIRACLASKIIISNQRRDRAVPRYWGL